MKSLLLLAQIGFVILSIVYLGLLIREFRTALHLAGFDEVKKKTLINRILITLIGWAAFVSLWSLSGIMKNFSLFPFNIAPIMVIPLVAVIVITLSPTFTELLRHIPRHHIIRLQSFRFFVELLLWALFVAGNLPIQIIWNIACLGLLMNIVTVAIMSMPGPLLVFDNEPRNTIVAVFPISWLPGLLVPLAYTLHFFSLRQLLKK